MISNLLIEATVLSSLTLLFRIFSKEEYVSIFIDKLPYLIRKPITCGVCRTFWLAFISQFVFQPISNFFISWMVVGMISVTIFYVFLTFYEGSHYLAHKAEEMHK